MSEHVLLHFSQKNTFLDVRPVEDHERVCSSSVLKIFGCVHQKNLNLYTLVRYQDQESRKETADTDSRISKVYETSSCAKTWRPHATGTWFSLEDIPPVPRKKSWSPGDRWPAELTFLTFEPQMAKPESGSAKMAMAKHRSGTCKPCVPG